jgi:hypothetical protein
MIGIVFKRRVCLESSLSFIRIHYLISKKNRMLLNLEFKAIPLTIRKHYERKNKRKVRDPIGCR